MRIIAGQHKGRKLLSVAGDRVRPTADRIKTHIFDRIGDLTHKWVLDLFAGTGALGIEAISRGAEKVIFVDRAKRSLETVKKNLQLIHVPEQAILTRMDAVRYLGVADRDGLVFDLIFADPPYDFDRAEQLIEAVMDGSVLAAGRTFVFELRTVAHSFKMSREDIRSEETTIGSTSIIWIYKSGEVR